MATKDTKENDLAGEQKKSKKKAEPLRKITVKAVWGDKPDIEQILAAPDKILPMMQVYGVAKKAKLGTSDYGDFVRFLGDFRAVNMKTGKLYRSSVLLLPRFLEDDLAAALGGEGTAAEFAVEISAKYDKSAATQYVYLADSLVEAAETDAMKALENRISTVGRSKRLAAPGASK